MKTKYFYNDVDIYIEYNLVLKIKQNVKVLILAIAAFYSAELLLKIFSSNKSHAKQSINGNFTLN